MNSTAASCDLNFKVEATFHYQFKNTAGLLGISMKELLELCYELLEKHPDYKDVCKRVKRLLDEFQDNP